MAKSLNPMDAFRREQKKKELKKHKTERQRDKKQKLATMDAEELKTQVCTVIPSDDALSQSAMRHAAESLKTLERQVQMNPADGPTRKRKQELEDTLNAVLKKQKEMEAEQKQEEQVQKEPKTIQELTEANKERYQNPENSVYYHPTLNPFGVPPPGRPQMYRVPPPATTQSRPPQQHTRPYHANDSRPMRGGRGPPRFQGNRGTGYPSPPAPVEPSKRPGKRPPLPPGPPPPGTIQVPMRPPLPRGALPFRPPPPPSAPSSTIAAPPSASAPHVASSSPPAAPILPHSTSPPPPPSTPVSLHEMQPEAGPVPPHPQVHDDTMDEANSADAYEVPMDMDDEESVVAPYPTMDSPDDYGNGYDSDQQQDHNTIEGAPGFITEDDEEREEKQAQLRSLVPVALRVQRRAPGMASGALRPRAAPMMNPVPRPASAMPVFSAHGGASQRAVATAVGPPAAAASTKASDGSVSKEYDAFMEEMKSLGAL